MREQKKMKFICQAVTFYEHRHGNFPSTEHIFEIAGLWASNLHRARAHLQRRGHSYDLVAFFTPA